MDLKTNYELAAKNLSEKCAEWRRRDIEEEIVFPKDTKTVLKRWVVRSLECVVLQGPVSINGYVRVPVGHPNERDWYEDLNVEIHGGLTFRCRVSNGSWFGFDTAHAGDYSDALRIPGRRWTAEDVARETESLAEQLAALAKADGKERE